MHDRLQVRTADNVGIAWDTAGIGSRVLAFLLDLVVVLLLVIAVDTVVVAVSPDSVATPLVVGGASFFVFLLYFVVLETVSGGRTPGKRILGLRVVRRDGGAVGLSEATVRGIVRVFDIAVGVVPMFVDASSRRFGDLVAGTVVVRERSAIGQPPPPPPVLLRTPDPGPAIDGIAALGAREASALRTFLSRPGVTPDQRARVAAVMAGTLLDRMHLPAGAPERAWPPELFLERLHLQLAQRNLSG